MSELELYKEEMRRKQRERNRRFNQKNKGTYECKVCDKKYNYSSGIYRHKKSISHIKAMTRQEGEKVKKEELPREQEGEINTHIS